MTDTYADALPYIISAVFCLYVAGRKGFNTGGSVILALTAPLSSAAAIMLLKPEECYCGQKEIEIYKKRRWSADKTAAYKTVTVLAAVLIPVLMFVHIGRLASDALELRFLSDSSNFEVGTGEPDGEGLVLYDIKSGEYSYKCIPEEYSARERSEIGGIVEYKSFFVKDGAMYGYSPYADFGTYISWELQCVDVKIIERSTGRVLESTSFQAHVPGRVYEDETGGKRYVGEDTVANWIRSVWSEHLEGGEETPDAS